ncbi:MAG TPA: hypothetical protein DEA22_01255 [Blastocatellia bacterium]|nr:hypothetical protein [Blastocatellia bacterium]
MFYFRINKVKILNNKTGKGIFGSGSDKATVQLWSLIVNGNIDLPNLEEMMATNDQARKKEIVSDIVQKVAASRRLTPIESVRDNMDVFFGDTGYVLFQSREIPMDFSWQFAAIKLNNKTRDIGREMQNVINHNDFDPFANSLPALVGATVNPAFTAAVEVGKFIFGILANNSAHKKDKQLGLLYMSLNRVEHYLHGVRDRQDVPDLSGNMRVDYSIFAYDDEKIHE